MGFLTSNLHLELTLFTSALSYFENFLEGMGLGIFIHQDSCRVRVSKIFFKVASAVSQLFAARMSSYDLQKFSKKNQFHVIIHSTYMDKTSERIKLPNNEIMNQVMKMLKKIFKIYLLSWL